MSNFVSKSYIALLLLHLAFLVLGQGTQFITGPCTSDSVCASGCCGFKSGKCAGPIIAQERDGGCGFGDPSPNANAAIALGFHPTSSAAAGASTPASTAAASGSGSKAAGTQFITGACTSDSICASGCCGFKSGKCAGPIIAQERDGGCGSGDPSPNANAAIALGFHPPASSTAAAATTVPSSSTQSSSGTTGAGNKAGKQFITGPCTSDADCASGCCGFKSGKCAGAIVAQERDGGCGFGNATPNDTAARALRGGSRLRMRTVERKYWG